MDTLALNGAAVYDTSPLENKKAVAGGHSYRCLLCKEEGADKKGNNLYIYDSGVVRCQRDPEGHSAEMRKTLQPAKPKKKQRPVEVAWHDYENADGEFVFQVVKRLPKDFRQRHKDNAGKWVWNMQGVTRVPYRLPELLAADKAEPVFIIEGEKDVETLIAAGCVSTTNPGGAGKWLTAYGDHLKGRDVVLMADNDEAGRAHTPDVARKLRGVAKSIRVVDLAQHWKDCPYKGDVSDWIKAEKPTDPKAQLLEWAAVVVEKVAQPEQETAPEPKAPEAFYDTERREFLTENKEGVWVGRNEGQFKRLLRSRGISSKMGEALISPVEGEMEHLMDTRTVRYAAPLSGRQAGYYNEGGVRFLVTESLNLPTPAPGSYPVISQIIAGLFGQGEHRLAQVETLMGWLRCALVSLHSDKRQRGQAMAFAGAANCGKSLFQKIITELLGGRSAKAALFLAGRTDFNADLFEAEHLMLEDEFMSPNNAKRKHLGAQIKNVVANDDHFCHRKGRTALTLTPWWRVSISVNDDPDALRMLPPLDDNVGDKITVLRAERFKMPMQTETPEQQTAFWRKIVSEIPQFTHYLLNTETPEELRCNRFGVKTWHNPDLAAELDLLSDELHLLDMIDRALFDQDGAEQWEGTHNDLKRELIEDASTAHEARELLNWKNATGTLLGQLIKKRPERLNYARSNSTRRWRITPPISD